MTKQESTARDLAAATTQTRPTASADRRKPHKIAVVVDTQVDFVMRHGLLAVDGAEAIIAPGSDMLRGLDADEYAAVLFTYDTHTAVDYMGSLENVGQPELGIPGFPLHCEKGTAGWENVFDPRLVPAGIPVFELEKSVFDAWEKPGDETPVWTTDEERRRQSWMRIGRDEFFEWLETQGVTAATVIGVASDYCVKDQIRGLLARGLQVEVVEAATAGITRDIRTTIAEEFSNQVAIV